MARRSRARAVSCSAIIRSSSRARSTSIALILFCNCDFWSCWLTTSPVGRWVMRTALSVVFTLCPPGPDERKTSILRSLGSILISTSSASGSTATVAAEVAGRLGAAHGDDRFLDPTEGPVAQRHRLPAETVALGIALIHAVEVGR